MGVKLDLSLYEKRVGGGFGNCVLRSISLIQAIHRLDFYLLYKQYEQKNP